MAVQVLAVSVSGRYKTASSTVYSTIWKNDNLDDFVWSKRLFTIKLMHGNTDTTSYVPILTWSGMTSSLTSHGSLNDIAQHFSLNSFLVLSFDTNMSNFNVDGKF